MAFGRQIHDPVRTEPRQGLVDGGAVADIALDEGKARIAGDGRERGEIAGVGELVEDQNFVRRMVHDAARHRRSDESGAASHENAHPTPSVHMADLP